VQRYRVPDHLDLVRREPFVGQEPRGQVGTVEVEAGLTVSLVAESHVVESTAEEQQLGVVVTSGVDASLLSEETAVEIRAHAVVEDGGIKAFLGEPSRLIRDIGARKEQVKGRIGHRHHSVGPAQASAGRQCGATGDHFE
jgi:hypothetical protein